MIGRARDRLLEILFSLVILAILYAYLRRRTPPN